MCIICLSATAHNSEAQSAENIVRDFFNNISYWFQYGKSYSTRSLASEYRKKAINLTIGENRCKVDDKVTDLTGYGEGFVADWLTFFNKERVEAGCSLTINTIRYDCEEPRYNTVRGGTWIYADVTIHYDNQSVRIKDYLRVLDGKIHKIDREGSEFDKAKQLYNAKRYDEAFPIFLKISEKNANEFEAQYYAVMMITLKQGCKYLNKEKRIDYAVKYSYNGYKAHDKLLSALYLKFYYTKTPR